MALTKEEIANICKIPSAETEGFTFLQTTVRVKNPRNSLWFYNNVLGMNLLQKMDFPQAKFSVYFLGYEPISDIPTDSNKSRSIWAFSKRGTLELTHNWGTETDPSFKYELGTGFGHISIQVPDVDEACKRFESLGVDFKKKPNEGAMKGLAFIRDPDGYVVEIYSHQTVVNHTPDDD